MVLQICADKTIFVHWVYMSIDYFVHNEAAIYKAVVIRGRDYFSINTLTDICTCLSTRACLINR